MSKRRGTVWHASHRVGRLSEDANGRMSLSYDEDWRATGFSISLVLPVSTTPDNADAHFFFAGLLPEGLARQRICRQRRLEERDDFGLLLAIGRDCAGALAVLPEDIEPIGDDEPVVVSHEEFALLVRSHGQAIPSGGTRQRFSLAGAQDKIALRLDGRSMWLPGHLQPSTHILKFETTKQVCFAEYAAHDMARRLGFDVPDTSYHRHVDAQTPYLQISRYDREVDEDGKPRRLHQEDLTQALGYPSTKKYEEHGGPSLGNVAGVLRQHCAQPAKDVVRLRDWQFFNYLVGNSDGHAKNIALVYPAGSSVPNLAPHYDLVCIEFLNRLGMHFDRKMAFNIGGNNQPEQVTRDDWIAFAKALQVAPKPMLGRLEQFASELPGIAQETRAAFASEFGDNQVYDRFEESIRDRCGWTQRSVFASGAAAKTPQSSG